MPGYLRCDGLYVLWLWQPRIQQWRELARAVSEAWEWAVELRPIALRALKEARGEASAGRKAADLDGIADDISVFLDKQLDSLEPANRARLLEIIYDQVASRLSA
jgi:hypothetical protein